MKGDYQLYQNDEMNINLSYQKQPEDFFFYQNPNGPGVPFIMRILTKFMLETMAKVSHNNIISMDSIFSINKYRVS